MRTLSRSEVRRLYLDGVAGVRAVTRDLTPQQWEMPACGAWTATQTARHLVSVAGWYHEWLDRARAGETTPPFPGASIDAYTNAALDEHLDLGGREAVAAFADSATGYLERATADWDLPYAYPFGLVTAGTHLGVAAVEWHLHAWDLSVLGPARYVPADPARLMNAAGTCVATARGGARGAFVRAVLPIVTYRSAWRSMLRMAGRR